MGWPFNRRHAEPRGPRPGQLATACTALSLLAVALASGGPAWPPPTLRETGLYSDWATKTVAPENLPFSPQYPLWSDGAQKHRWLRIPRGTFIDGTNPDVWRFPVGTRAWKEFRFDRRVETRFIERTRGGWKFAAYAWNDDESEAPLAPERGVPQSVEIADGLRHAIPSRIDCTACHEAGPSRLLGVSALQLSPDRDPNAPHAEAVPEGAVDLKSLIDRGMVRRLPARFVEQPPRIEAPTPVARAALGYLHANCGGCHTRTGDLASLSFALNYLIARAEGGPSEAQLTAVGTPSTFKVPLSPDTIDRICAGRPDLSVVMARMSSRYPLLQMPPLGTRLVDDEAVALIRKWITEDVKPPVIAPDNPP
jgi:hypothetical protein